MHPGEFDVTDEQGPLRPCSDALNLLVDQLVAQPKRIDELYGRLPEGARQAIQKRAAGGS
jgi:hypothetical protein